MEKRQQCPFRLWSDDYEAIRAKASLDKISFQDLVELLLLSYLKDEKHIKAIVQKHTKDLTDKRKNKTTFTELEAEQLLNKIQAFSPVEEMDKIAKGK